ncbi:MAG: hypothetical protein WCT05_00510 [Lentisphaeria bacterium]
MNAKRPSITLLLEFLQQSYAPTEFPALLEQFRSWQKIRPFAGQKILEATPLFRNTLAKFLPLLAGGADLYVSQNNALPCDPAIAALLPDFGIPTVDNRDLLRPYDVVMDCAGLHAQVPSRCGYIELTRSGLAKYQNTKQPVFLADEGRCKVIETCLGTGDGFLRAMQSLGYQDWDNRKIIIFGAGKVGRGIAFYCKKAGAEVFLVDDRSKITAPAGIKLLDWKDFSSQKPILSLAWCIISATGIRDALKDHPILPKLLQQSVLFANMGVEDEFGASVPDKNRILNQNRPLNFLLEEPTRLPFIDPTMALCNQATLELLSGHFPAGLNRPQPALEKPILDLVTRKGCLARELEGLSEIAPAGCLA